MKAMHKQLWGYLLITLLLAGFTPLQAQTDSADESDYITVSGVVKDKKSKKSLEYVNISIPGTTTGTVTNADGEFSFKVKDSIQAKEVEISYLGYYNAKIPLNGENIEKETVWLTPYTNMLEEVIIHARDPRYLVEEAIKKIPANYNPKHSLLTGFYRETAQKGRRYINISEAVIDIYKTPYNETADRDRVQIFKGRKLLSQKASDTLAVKLLGGPNMSIYVDVVKNPDVILELESLPYYKFRMEESTTINDRPQYVINFEPQAILPYALYYGKLYIDKERLSFTRAEFFLDMNDRNKATQAILRKKPFGLRFKPVEVSFLVNYQDRDGVTYLSYIRNGVRFKCDWKRKLFSTNYTILSEMVVTDGKESTTNAIPYKMAFKQNQSLSDKVADFADANFWGSYNIIEPTESLEHAVDRLKKQHK
ncbi:carboxypeptidase-like regulatory domain-containing protein [Parabacteroides acidifaciens]|uniref:Carboxypeptidase-like regulatory domain-containing protein n=1 Tax=Parabacteroides acidifaciens TaxID=2290935 RepID=A0A3D8HFT4_9BACT|nr:MULTISPECIES: carboxypeptidase-like regulatory domain-containing protein [Parabacteroides]MBC8601620.1 carboxypeptidase-like regulatory domain-containing protein [Parabacteroides acidifaciens]RDU49610.1 carboxypeptidase-like regulatory domain-containing protein [Parabacteroides acidifaciens]RHO71458.1 carboxypeptidase-like regulatory domain-containing protein [Parabacteroides sp. AF48-14]